MSEEVVQIDTGVQKQGAPKKMGRKPKKKDYFAEEQEEAFRKYLVCEDKAERDRIFEKQIYPSLCKMVECLIRRYYLFTVDETYEDTFYDTLSFLITKINNFDPSKNCKAYSYCGTVCKNYLILRRTQSIKKRDKLLSYEMVYSGHEKDNRVSDEYSENDFHSKLINNTKKEIKEILNNGCIDKRELTNNEVKLGKALIEILNNWEGMIDDSSSRKFNKVSILYFIKEYTLCTTTEVRNAMKIYKNLYLFTKQDLLKE
nr:MAG TPA: hypothetical protein [Ackermannviridae sp.]